MFMALVWSMPLRKLLGFLLLLHQKIGVGFNNIFEFELLLRKGSVNIGADSLGHLTCDLFLRIGKLITLKHFSITLWNLTIVF